MIIYKDKLCLPYCNLAMQPTLPVNVIHQQQIYDFALKQSEVNCYRAERRAKDDQLVKQIYTGKLGESFLDYLIKSVVPDLTAGVDWEIYEAGHKSWSADLPYYSKDGKLGDIHVKTYARYKGDTDNRIPVSWTFNVGNASGSGGRDRLLEGGGENDVVALVVVGYDTVKQGNRAGLCALLPCPLAVSLLREPVLPAMRGIKKCIYLKDITEYFLCLH